jgi:hypothetical protein
MTTEERNTIQNQIAETEKNLAVLRQKLEGRPTHVQVPLSVFHLDRYPDLENADDLTVQKTVRWLETEVVSNLLISVQC